MTFIGEYSQLIRALQLHHPLLILNGRQVNISGAQGNVQVNTTNDPTRNLDTNSLDVLVY